MDRAGGRGDAMTPREQALQRFEQLGWPTTQWEEWRYTNVAPIAKGEWRVGSAARPAEAGPHTYPEAAAEAVFINGFLASSRGDIQVLSKSADHPAVQKHFAQYADYQRHPFTALNTANAQDGAVIVIPDGKVVEGFIHILFMGDGDGVWSHPRNLIVVGRNAQVAVVESYAGSGSYFTNAVTEIFAGDGAVIDHYKIECESRTASHIATVQIHQERASNVTTRHIALGGGLVRNEVNVALAGEGAGLTLDGLFVLSGTQHVDNHTIIDHVKPHCDSLELYKGILDDRSRGIFDGRIIVREGAQKTNSRQVNHNMLLSETAIIDSKPTLEILNDDVKCNHGSTIGQLNDEALFYLRSRGIDEAEARKLLVYGFASEIVDRMKLEPVKDRVRREMFGAIPHHIDRREQPR
jgi:Fe-S cluster assembly protein SufD